MRSKERVLEMNMVEGECFVYTSDDFFDGRATTVLNAMDEYAGLIAIKFAKWLNDWYYMDDNGFYHHDYQNKKHFSNNELFHLFKIENNI